MSKAQATGPVAGASVSDATCNANGSITVHVTSHTGTVYYALVAPSTQTIGISTNPVFSNLATGSYTVAVYDDNTGTDVNNPATHPTLITNVMVRSTYQPLVITNTQADGSGGNLKDCTDYTGRILLHFTGGKTPFQFKLTRQNDPTTIVSTGALSAPGQAVFNGLPADDYTVTIMDSCGTTVTANVSVTIDNNLEHFMFYPGSAYANQCSFYMQTTGCDTLLLGATCRYFGINNNDFYVAGINSATGKQVSILGTRFQIRMEYPGGSGRWTAWYQTDGSNTMALPGFIATNPGAIHLQVKNPCTGQTIDLPEVAIPALSLYSNTTMIGSTVCTAQPCIFVQTAYGYNWAALIPGFLFPATVSFTEKNNPGNTFAMPWNSTTTTISNGTYLIKSPPLAYGTTYVVAVTTGCGAHWEQTLTTPQTAPNFMGLYAGWSCQLDSVSVYPIWSTGITQATGKVTATILSGPGTMTGKSISRPSLPASNYDLGFMGPFGKYTMQLDFYDSLGNICHSEIDTVNAKQTFRSFSIDSVLVSPGTTCGLYNIYQHATYYTPDRIAYPSSNYVAVLKNGAGNYAVTGTNNDGTVRLTNIPAGRYTLYSVLNDNCSLNPMDSITLDLPIYTLPEIDVAKSGGVVCLGDTAGTLKVVLKGGTGTPFMFALYTGAGEIKPVQSASRFTNLPAGNYTVKVKDNCGSVVSQDLSLLTATALQHLVVGGRKDTVCNGSEVKLSTIPVGAIDSIRWYRPTGVLAAKDTQSIYIPHFSAQDAGIYTAIIYAGSCSVRAETPNLSIAPIIPAKYIGGDTALCVGDTSRIIYEPSGGYWVVSDTLVAGINSLGVINAETAGTTIYLYHSNNRYGCLDSTTGSITVWPLPSFTAQPVNATCTTPGMIRFQSITGLAPYLFYINGIGQADSSVQRTNGSYDLFIKDANGCSSLRDTITIADSCVPPPFKIPNVFSPNGDGANEYWQITGIPTGAYMKVTIYNRWGSRVYQSNPYTNDWTGGGLHEGTYYYVLSIVQPAGTEQTYKGTILLIR